VRLGGALYLIALAVKSFRSSAPSDIGTVESLPTRSVYTRGLFNNLANPKIVVFFVAFLPQFASPGKGALPLLGLGAVFTLIGLGVDLLLSIGGGAVRDRIVDRVHVRRRLEQFAGVVYAGLASRLIWTWRAAT
jgi:threonine/homoserine/homoserine lactone efflux protein